MTERDIDQVVEKLSESDDDFVFSFVNHFDGQIRLASRRQMAESTEKTVRDLIAYRSPMAFHSGKVLKPFTTKDGIRFLPKQS